MEKMKSSTLTGTIRDALWIWGHDAGCYHRHANNFWKLPGLSRMTPTEAAFYLGIPNIMMVRFGNQPAPPFRQYALPMRPLRRMVWSIIGDLSSTDNDRQPDLQEIISLSAEFPNLTGALMDDFFRNEPGAPGRFSAEQVAGFRRQLHAARRPLELYVVVSAHDLDLPLRQHLDAVDAITFWTWHAKDLAALERNFCRLEELAPQPRKLLGLYLWDFGACAPIPMAA
ncbi:MAG: hypothetical protein NTV22_17315, partial [bacterium]|nr:hypothetical protein [bacterium]